jgi:CxxC-x17-CxxC domain-containing protein
MKKTSRRTFEPRDSKPNKSFSTRNRFESQDRFTSRDSKPSFSKGRSFPAVCSACGVNCDTPFEPRPGQDVYCRECFKSGQFDRGPKSGSKFGSDRPERSAPRSTSPLAPAAPSKELEKLSKRIDELHDKIDLLVEILTEEYDDDEDDFEDEEE